MCDGKTAIRKISAVDEVAIRRMMPARSEKELREYGRELAIQKARDLAEGPEHPFCEKEDRRS